MLTRLSWLRIGANVFIECHESSVVTSGTAQAVAAAQGTALMSVNIVSVRLAALREHKCGHELCITLELPQQQQ